jgi:hypothetical protein
LVSKDRRHLFVTPLLKFKDVGSVARHFVEKRGSTTHLDIESEDSNSTKSSTIYLLKSVACALLENLKESHSSSGLMLLYV